MGFFTFLSAIARSRNLNFWFGLQVNYIVSSPNSSQVFKGFLSFSLQIIFRKSKFLTGSAGKLRRGYFESFPRVHWFPSLSFYNRSLQKSQCLTCSVVTLLRGYFESFQRIHRFLYLSVSYRTFPESQFLVWFAGKLHCWFSEQFPSIYGFSLFFLCKTIFRKSKFLTGSAGNLRRGYFE